MRPPPADPKPDTGTARFTGAKAEVGRAIGLCPRAVMRRHGLVVKKRADGCGCGGGRRRVSGAASREGLSCGLPECGGSRPGGAGDAERARWARMASAAMASCSSIQVRARYSKGSGRIKLTEVSVRDAIVGRAPLCHRGFKELSILRRDSLPNQHLFSVFSGLDP